VAAAAGGDDDRERVGQVGLLHTASLWRAAPGIIALPPVAAPQQGVHARTSPVEHRRG